MAKRDTSKYHFKVGNKTVHTGVTKDLDRRDPGQSKGHIVKVGCRTTHKAALAWEDEQRKKGKPTGP